MSDLFENHVGFPTRRHIYEINASHSENMPLQYTEKFLVVKMKIFTGKNFDILFLLKT